MAKSMMVPVQPENPLLMRDVLEAVFGYLSVKCVWKCRQVCAEWNRVASPIFEAGIHEIEIVFRPPDPNGYDDDPESDSEVEVDTDEDDDENNSDSDSDNKLPNICNRICRYMNRIKSSPFNFTTFAFKHWDLGEKWAQTFLSQRGQFIRKLRLDYTRYLKEEYDLKSKQLQDILVKYAPNIEELDLTVPGLQTSPIFDTDSKPDKLKIKRLTIQFHLDHRIKAKVWGYDCCTQEFLTDLFKPSNNLESVTIREYPERNNSDFADGRFDTIPILNALIDTGRMKGLKELNLANVTGEIFQLLGSDRFVSSGCQLSKFTTQGEVDWIYDRMNWMTFESFLNSQNLSLEYLSIHLTTRDPKHSRISKLKFPEMKNLKSLELYFDIERQYPYPDRIHLEPFDFGSQFSALIEFKIPGTDHSWPWPYEEYAAKVLESTNSS